MVTNYIWFIVSLILCSWAQEAGYYAPAGSESCEASMNDWCASNSPYRYARLDVGWNSNTEAWRCYSSGALTADTYRASTSFMSVSSNKCPSGLPAGIPYANEATCWGHWSRDSQLQSLLDSCTRGDGCFSSALIGRYCLDRNQIGSDSDHREITQTECQSRCTTDPTCGGINYYPSRNGGDCRLFTNTNCQTSYSRYNDAIHQMRESCPRTSGFQGDHVCYEVSTSGWNCPNGISIDGTYLVVETINNKQAWRKADGVYLRWASMWSQWIFDDDTEDTTSIAWHPNTGSIQDALEVQTPPTGTTNLFRYGGTCGGTGHYRDVVSSLTITETTCPEYIKLANLNGFCGSTNLGRPNVESVYPSTGSVGFLEYQNALAVEGCSHNLDDWYPNYMQCGGACYAVCEYLGKLECDRLGDQCAGFRIHGYYGTSLFAPDFENCMSVHPTSNFGDDGFRIEGGWTFYYKPSTHEEMVALNTPKPSPAPTRKPSLALTACDDFLVEYDGDDVAIQALVGTYQKRTDCDRSEGGANFGGVDISICFEGPDSFLIWNTGCGWQIGKHEADDEMTDWKRRAMTYAGSCSQIPAEGKTTAALTTQSYFNRLGQVIVGLSSRSVCDPIADRRRLKVKQQSRLRRLLNLISDLE